MKPWERWMSHISTLVVTLTGVAYLWMKYFVENDDPFSVVNHPWQPGMLSLHLLAAPFLVFVVGLMVNSHIRKKLQSGVRSNRISGLVSLFTLPLMVVSGYALQVVTDPTLVRVTLVAHLASSGVFAVTYIAHQIVSFRLLRRGSSGRLGEAPLPRSLA